MDDKKTDSLQTLTPDEATLMLSGKLQRTGVLNFPVNKAVAEEIIRFVSQQERTYKVEISKELLKQYAKQPSKPLNIAEESLTKRYTIDNNKALKSKCICIKNNKGITAVDKWYAISRAFIDTSEECKRKDIQSLVKNSHGPQNAFDIAQNRPIDGVANVLQKLFGLPKSSPISKLFDAVEKSAIIEHKLNIAAKKIASDGRRSATAQNKAELTKALIELLEEDRIPLEPREDALTFGQRVQRQFRKSNCPLTELPRDGR